MNERLKEIRKALGLTLDKFGEKVGLRKSSLSQIERGTNNVTNQLVVSVCREFNVNEQWLRTGEGDMFVHHTREEELAIKLGHILRNEKESLRTAVFAAIINMDENGCKAMEDFLKDVLEHVNI